MWDADLSSMENPFQAWQDASNDYSILGDACVATRFYQGLALTAAMTHLFPWLKRVYPLCCAQTPFYSKEAVERWMAFPRRLWGHRGEQRVVTDQLSTTAGVTSFLSQVAFLVMLPCMFLFSLAFYIGLPAAAFYGLPYMSLADPSSALALRGLVLVVWMATLHGLDVLANYWVPIFENEKPHKMWQRVGRLGLIMAFFGALCLSAFSTKVATLDATISYVGPVRLSHINMYYHNDVAKNQATADTTDTEYPYVYASWTAEFGSTWACPHLPDDHWCQVRQTACHHTACYKNTCTESEIDLSRAMTRECLNMISLHWSDAASDHDATFDRGVSPAHDGQHWPSMNAYANCETCEIYGGTRTGYADAQELLRNLPAAQRLRRYGVQLLLAGWILSGLVLVWTCMTTPKHTHGGDFVSIPALYDTLHDGDLELEIVSSPSTAEAA